MSIKNQVQLITYPDSLGGDLKALHTLLVKHFTQIFPSGVHILPPFPSSGDRGFAPQNYFEIEPRFGTWEDIRQIGRNFPVLVDLMANHISRKSPYFQDFLEKGRRSEYAGLFLTLEKVWPDGQPVEKDVAKIFVRKSQPPFVDVKIAQTGKIERVWNTFWSEQIDLDVHSPETRRLFRDILAHFSRQGIKMVRLDAVAYVIKKPGTSCFFVEPDLWEFTNWISVEAQAVGIDVLPEVHAHYDYQMKLAEQGFWVYNFILPLLVLHTLLNKSSASLREHLQGCPSRQFTMLDCHDGIPVQPDLDGVIDIDDAQRVVQVCRERGANVSPIFSVHHRLRPDYEAHQINCTYYSALDSNADAYLAARAIQFFAPGVPQVYCVGLLAGENDLAEVERTGERRAINRRNYTTEEVEQALQQPVVKRLLELIRFRNEYEAFQGSFQVLKSGDRELRLAWEMEQWRCELVVDLDLASARIEYRAANGKICLYRP